MTTWIFVFGLLWPLLWLIRLLTVTKLLLGFEFQRERVEPLTPERIPTHLSEAAQPWIARLETVRFRPIGGWMLRRSEHRAFDKRVVVMAHVDHPVRALVRPHDTSARSGECWVSLRTTTADGQEIVTSSHGVEELVPRQPGVEIEILEGYNTIEGWIAP